jgi:hypothetical protein
VRNFLGRGTASLCFQNLNTLNDVGTSFARIESQDCFDSTESSQRRVQSLLLDLRPKLVELAIDKTTLRKPTQDFVDEC